jgi:DNA-binding phage protein
MRDRSYEEGFIQRLKQDPAYAAALLNSVLEDGDAAELQVMLHQFDKAFPGTRTGMPAETGNREESSNPPSVGRLSAVVKAMGMKLVVATAAQDEEIADAAARQAVA